MYTGDFSLTNRGSRHKVSLSSLHKVRRHLARALVSTCPQSKPGCTWKRGIWDMYYTFIKNLITNKVLLKVWHHSLNHKSWKNDAFIFYPITCITIYMIKIACIFHWIKERALSSKLHVNVFHSYTYILEFRLSCDTNF